MAELSSFSKNNVSAYKELAELLPQTVFEMNRDGILTFSNKNGLLMFGYSQEDFNRGLHVLQMVAPEERPKAEEKIKSIFAGSKTGTNEYTALKKDGTRFSVIINSSPIIKNKEITGLRGIIIDITERKRFENELLESENKFRKLTEKSLVGIYFIQDNKFLYVNNRLAELFGYSADELINKKGPLDLTAERDRDVVIENINKRLSSVVESINYQFKGIRKDASLIDVEVHGAYTTFHGRAALVGTLMDITERKKAESALKKLSVAVEQSPVSIIITDTNGIIEYVNPKFTQVTGYSIKEVIGKSPSLLKSGEQDDDYYKNLWSTILKGNEWRGELHNKKKNKELFWEAVSISPIKNERGIITHFLAVKEDITHKKLVEKELKEAKEKSEETNRLKSSFLANMSHEIRTPLIGILGFAEILREELHDPEQREMADTILISGQRLLDSLNMILDLSRLEADRHEFNLKPLNIADALQKIINLFSPVIKSKNLDFSLSVSNDEIVSRLDETVFYQIIKNLLNNAIKFTSSGGIKVEAHIEDTPSGTYNVIKIADTGIGIGREEQKIIFTEFRQAKEGFNRPYEGTGLGLTISKKFVQLMGGRIDLHSETGHGSTFIIRFPSIKQLPVSQFSVPPIYSAKFYEMPAILSVENDLSAIKIIRYFLKNLCQIDHAENGEKAIKLIEKNHYNAILLDINLGVGMDGLEAVKEIKKFPHCREIPIIAVTSYALPSDKEKFLKSGCTHYVSKPFERSVLVDLMNQILNNN